MTFGDGSRVEGHQQDWTVIFGWNGTEHEKEKKKASKQPKKMDAIKTL